jgi:hypothetical protein
MCRKTMSGNLYYLDESLYCPLCFPHAVNVKVAREKLAMHEKEKS